MEPGCDCCCGCQPCGCGGYGGYDTIGDYDGRPRSGSGYVIDVEVPAGVGPGDRIEVRVPLEAGGGSVVAVVPSGARKGSVFEIVV